MMKKKALKKAIATSLTIVAFLGGSALAVGETDSIGQSPMVSATPAQGQGVSVEDYFRAAESGDVDTVIRCLQNGVNVNVTNSSGRTALMVASYYGRVNVVQELLNLGGDPEICDDQSDTALLLAAENGHTDVATHLLENGADSNVQDVFDCTALMLAAQNGNVEFVNQLLHHGANPDMQDDEGFTALMFAVENEDIDVVCELLNCNANPNIRRGNRGPEGNWTALTLAVNYEYTDAVRTLLNSGKISEKNRNISRNIAIERGNQEIVDLLNNYIPKPPAKRAHK